MSINRSSALCLFADPQSGTPTFNPSVWVLSGLSGNCTRRTLRQVDPLRWRKQLGQRSTHRAGGGRQKDHEAFQHPRAFEADLSGTQTSEAPSTRECMYWVLSGDQRTDLAKVISLSDIFISPLEDM